MNWGFGFTRVYIFCLMISVSFMCHYGVALMHFFRSGFFLALLPLNPDWWRILPHSCPSTKMSHWKKLQYVVLPEQPLGLFSDQSSSLDLPWRLLSVVRTPDLVRCWGVPVSFHLVMREFCVSQWLGNYFYTFPHNSCLNYALHSLDFLVRAWPGPF